MLFHSCHAGNSCTTLALFWSIRIQSRHLTPVQPIKQTADEAAEHKEAVPSTQTRSPAESLATNQLILSPFIRLWGTLLQCPHQLWMSCEVVPQGSGLHLSHVQRAAAASPPLPLPEEIPLGQGYIQRHIFLNSNTCILPVVIG